jgi:hypothetical protein
MKLTPIKSSNIKAIGYDASAKTLAVEFLNGVYHYNDVPPEVHASLVGAESAGKFFASNIRGKFNAAKQNTDGH